MTDGTDAPASTTPAGHCYERAHARPWTARPDVEHDEPPACAPRRPCTAHGVKSPSTRHAANRRTRLYAARASTSASQPWRNSLVRRRNRLVQRQRIQSRHTRRTRDGTRREENVARWYWLSTRFIGKQYIIGEPP